LSQFSNLGNTPYFPPQDTQLKDRALFNGFKLTLHYTVTVAVTVAVTFAVAVAILEILLFQGLGFRGFVLLMEQ
jgi:hypothetical protein